jgi:RecJ-like exonuclease
MPDFPTFRLVDSADDELEIERDDDGNGIVAAVRSEGGNTVYVRREESPAVALAILEAAGAHMLDGAVAQAIVSLRGHLEYRAAQKRREEAERKAAEEKAAKELDGATLAAYNAFRIAAPLGFTDEISSLAELPPSVVDAWRAATKAARESA